VYWLCGRGGRKHAREGRSVLIHFVTQQNRSYIELDWKREEEEK
jgi:hypothetical protein